MRLLIVSTVLAAILHTASALPYSAPFPFFSFIGLPKCVRSCKSIREATINCLPPTAPVSNNATYVACFCQSQLLHSGNNNGGICPQDCNKEDETTIQDTYKALCGLPGPSATLFPSVPAPTTSPTSTSTPTPSIPIALNTSKPTLAPTQISTPSVEEPQGQPEHNETGYVNTENPTEMLLLTSNRAHKNWIVIVAVVVPVVILILAILAWLKYCRHTQTREARTAAYERDLPREEILRRYHQNFFDRCQQGNPILIADNSLRGRLGRMLKRNKISPEEGQEIIPLQTVNQILRERYGLKLKGNEIVFDRSSKIKNRRARRRNFRISTNAPLLQPSPPNSAQGDQTPRRPASARTLASSVGQRSLFSPLSTYGSPHQTLAPPLPVRFSTPQTPRTPQTPQTPTILLPTFYQSSPATPRSAAFTRLPTTPQTLHMQRSFSSPLSPTSPYVDLTPPSPTRPPGGRGKTEDSVREYEDEIGRDEITPGSNSPISVWEVQKLRGVQ